MTPADLDHHLSQFRDGRRRIVELGGVPYVHSVFPQATDFFCTQSTRGERAPERGLDALTPMTVPRLVRALNSADLALVVVHVNRHAAWSPRKIIRSVFNRRIFRGDIPTFSLFGPHMARRPRVPIAAIDLDDAPLLMSHNFAILDRSSAYFMREIPGDRWRLLMGTAHPDLPTPRFRRKPRWLRRLEKIRPISIGLPMHVDPHAVPYRETKTTDIFFAGAIAANSSLRARGAAELASLQEQGIKVDLLKDRVSMAEFHRRCAAAFLTWSPEGLGHDCMRHYEAAVCGSVPVISRAPIERRMPLMEGRHAFYYDFEPGGLTACVRSALAAKDRLEAMGQAARAHVLAHHTPTANVEYLVSETLRAAAEKSADSGS